MTIKSSSKFNHGETLATIDGNFYKLYHNKIYKTNKQGDINYDDHNHPTNVKPLIFNNKKCCNDSNNSFTYVLYF